MIDLFRRYLLPGFVFQSVVIAGGYGTGRELVEFFLSRGPLGGLLAIGVSTVVWSAVAMASFEFARAAGAYDYRSFFRALLGRGWFLFEVCYLLLVVVVLAVIAAAAGAIGRDVFGLPYWAGVLTVMAAVGLLVFQGTETIERALAGWSLVLYGVYLVFFAWCFSRFGVEMRGGFAGESGPAGWVRAGVAYAGYNVAVVPAILFVARRAESRRESLVSGALLGPIAILPGLLFYLAMVGQHPAILDQEVPANFMLELLGSRTFQVVFQVVLFGTLIETGTGLIHAVNERIAGVFEEGGGTMPPALRPVLGVGFLVMGTVLARFGLIDLIARGYGILTWGIVVVFVVPVLTVGVWRVRTGRVPTR